MTFNPLDLSGRHVLITGASGGIGRATAILLSRLGAQLILHGRDGKRLQSCLAELEGPKPGVGTEHAVEPFDLADLDAIPDWLRDVAARRGKLTGLVHCAGIQVTKPVRVFDRAGFDETLHVNLGSALALARGFRHRQSNSGGGAIVFIASIAGFIGQPGNVVYAASKAGLMSATRGLAMELLRDSIRVNCIAPALIDSEMADRSRAGMTQEQFDHMVAQHPMGLGKPEDVANAVAFLIADTARWITGETLLVDGGYLAR